MDPQHEGKPLRTPLSNEGRIERICWWIHKESTRKRSLKADFDILWPEARRAAAALALWGRPGASGWGESGPVTSCSKAVHFLFLLNTSHFSIK